MAATAVSILHLEDSVLDAELVRDRLDRAGLVASIDLVSKQKDFIARLKARPYDVIISDYKVPTFEGLAALDLARAHQPDTPFIFVSGAMGEEFAVETLKSGATDYILKQRLTRLPAAVKRALSEKREKAERKKAEEEARRANEELRASEEQLREQDRRKDEFLATLAHELRNPLAPVRNGLRILKYGGNQEQLNKVLDMMERQVSHMVRLIDDLMDVSRITRGRVELRKERVELRTVVDSALEASRPLIDSAGHSLTVSVPRRLYLHADPTRMAQVIANLLNNAAKYTPEGGHISVTAEREGAGVIIRVKDTGLGIPADMLPRVFDMFTQVGRTLERSQGGLGIGLTLVRSLVELHGGTVDVESPGPDLGTTFTVRLRLAEEDVQSGPHSEGRFEPQTEGGLRVLVVDDNIDGAESLALLLGMSGHQTRTAHNGPDALVSARAFQPDLIFLDIGLPGMDGYAVAERLRAEPGAHDTKPPVLVALTGWGSESDRRRSKQAGFEHHLTKPVDAEQIQKLLGGLLQASEDR